MRSLSPLAALAILASAATPSSGFPAGPGATSPGGAEATPPPARGPDEAGEIGAQPLPPGSPADQALWKSAVATSNQITIERARAGRIQVRLKTERYQERLSAMGATESAERAGDLGKRLEAAWSKNYSYLTARWPVDPTRGCGYPALNFHSALHGSGKPQDQAMLLEARAEVESCVAKARPAVAAMKASNDELEAVAAEADRALAAAGLGSPTSAPASGAERRNGAGPASAPPPAR